MIRCKIFGHNGNTDIKRITFDVFDLISTCGRCGKIETTTIRKDQLRHGWFLSVDHVQNQMFKELERTWWWENHKTLPYNRHYKA